MLNFLGIGAQKTGTSWLYAKLGLHPQIHFPGEHKELHFFDQHLDKGFDYYHAIFEGNAEGVLHGEITPAYAILPLDVIAMVHRHYPDIKVIYMYRDPVARAWSAAKMHAGLEGMALEDVSEEWFRAHVRSEGSMARGDYEACLRNWLKFFIADQVMVVDYEQVANAPVDLLNRVAGFLGVDDRFFTTSHQETLSEKVFTTKDMAMPAYLREDLERLYAGKMESFLMYLNEVEASGCKRF